MKYGIKEINYYMYLKCEGLASLAPIRPNIFAMRFVFACKVNISNT